MASGSYQAPDLQSRESLDEPGSLAPPLQHALQYSQPAPYAEAGGSENPGGSHGGASSPSEVASSASSASPGRGTKRPGSKRSPGISRFALHVVQNPERARMTGFGEKDKRPIDPPVILLMTAYDEQDQPVRPENIPIDGLAVQVQIYSPDRTQQCAHVYYPSAVQTAIREAMSRGELPRLSTVLPSFYPTSSAEDTPPPVLARSEEPLFVYSTDPSASSSASTSLGPTTGASSSSSVHSPALSAYPGGGPKGPTAAYSTTPLSVDPTLQNLSALPYMPSSVFDEEKNHEENPEPFVVPAGYQLPEHLLPGTPESKTRNLLGGLTASAKLLKNEHDQIGVYFMFSELAVRAEGSFCLHFELVDLDEASIGEGAFVLADCFSEVFRVYSAKMFPGMSSSSELTKCFARQGLKLVLRESYLQVKSQETKS